MGVDAAGSVYITNGARCTIGKITPDGTLSVVAGSGGCGQPVNGPALATQLGYTYSLTVDPAGNLYALDYHEIVPITPGGTLSIIAGNGSNGSPVAGPALGEPADDVVLDRGRCLGHLLPPQHERPDDLESSPAARCRTSRATGPTERRSQAPRCRARSGIARARAPSAPTTRSTSPTSADTRTRSPRRRAHPDRGQQLRLSPASGRQPDFPARVAPAPAAAPAALCWRGVRQHDAALRGALRGLHGRARGGLALDRPRHRHRVPARARARALPQGGPEGRGRPRQARSGLGARAGRQGACRVPVRRAATPSAAARSAATT